jgi:hypothetical protein
MGARGASLDPSDVQVAAPKVHLVPAQVDQFSRPETVPVGDQRFIVASRWPHPLPLAALMRLSTSAGGRCSRVRKSLFGSRVGPRPLYPWQDRWRQPFERVPLPSRARPPDAGLAARRSLLLVWAGEPAEVPAVRFPASRRNVRSAQHAAAEASVSSAGVESRRDSGRRIRRVNKLGR